MVHEKKNLFLCNECPKERQKTFPKASKLKYHKEMVHQKKRPYVCEYCNKGYSTNQHYKIHKLTKHENRDFYKCDICDTQLGGKYNLKSHNETAKHKKREREMEENQASFFIEISIDDSDRPERKKHRIDDNRNEDSE